MTKTNTTVATILSTLSAEAVSELRSHFRTEVATEIAAGLVAPEKPAARRATAVKAPEVKKAGPNRQRTNDGTERSASQFIRDCGEEMSAKDVVEAAAKVGLDIEAPLVYNVRAQAKKKVEDAANAEEAAKKDEARKNALRQNAEKARAARKAKIEKEKAEKAATTVATETPAEAPAAPEAAAPEAPEAPEAPKAKGKGKKTAAAK